MASSFLQRKAKEQREDENYFQTSQIPNLITNTSTDTTFNTTTNQSSGIASGFLQRMASNQRNNIVQSVNGTSANLTPSSNDYKWLDNVAMQMRMAGADEDAIYNSVYKPYKPKPAKEKTDYYQFTQNSDYEQNKDYRSTKYGEGQRDALSGYMFDTGYGDIEHEIINKDALARMYYNANNGNNPNMENSYLDNLDDGQLDMYNYIYNTQGKDKAKEYIESIKKDLMRTQSVNEAKFWKEYSSRGIGEGIASNALTVLQNLAKPLEVISQAGDLLTTGEINEYNPLSSRITNTNNAITQAIGEKWDEAVQKGTKQAYIDDLRFNGATEDEIKYASENYDPNTAKGVGNFLYQTLSSMENFLATSALTGNFSKNATGISEALSLAIMGAGATADTVIEQKLNGADDGQAFTLGIVAGLAEIFTEKVSLETLLDAKLLHDNSLKYVLKNMLAEGSEEVFSDAINTLAEVLFRMNDSEFMQSIKSYMSEGYTEGEAVGLSVKDKALEMGLSFLGGAISGGIMGGVGTVRYNNAITKNILTYGDTLENADMQNSILEQGMTFAEDSESNINAQALKKLLEEGGTLSQRDMAKQLVLNSMDMASENKARAKEIARGEIKIDENLDLVSENSRVKEFAKNFNKSGQTVLESMYAGNIPAVDYNSKMAEVYKAGYTGKSMESTNFTGILTKAQMQAMYQVGVEARKSDDINAKMFETYMAGYEGNNIKSVNTKGIISDEQKQEMYNFGVESRKEGNNNELQLSAVEQWINGKDSRIITSEVEGNTGKNQEWGNTEVKSPKDTESVSLIRGKTVKVSDLIEGVDSNGYVTLIEEGKDTEHTLKAKEIAKGNKNFIKVCEEIGRDITRTFYTEKFLNCFSPTSGNITLEISNDMAGVIIDRFGKDVTFRGVDSTHSSVTLNVAFSTHFITWIWALGDKVKIVGPDSAVEDVKNEIRKLMKQYDV